MAPGLTASDQVEGFLSDAARWREAVKGRAPSNHRVLEGLEGLLSGGGPEAGAFGAKLEEAWRDRTFFAFYDRPLLVVAALRHEALGAGPGHPLWDALGRPDPAPETVTTARLLEALDSEGVWTSIRARYVQTNETSRAVAWLWPARIAGCDRGARPIALVEIGASAGLNLVADALPPVWTDAAGAALPVVTAPDVALRLGLDRNPLDVLDPDAVSWMRACLWAGERDREARFDAAVAAFRALPPRIERGDVTEAPARLAEVELAAGGLVLAFQTLVRDYLEPATRSAWEAGMRGWLASLLRGRGLWIELEIAAGAESARLPAAITAHVPDGRGGVVDLVLARTSFHPSAVLPDEEAVRRLRSLTAPVA